MSFPKALTGIAISSILVMLLAIPPMLEKVPKNGLYGFRTKTTMSASEPEWYRVNRIAGIGMFIAGFVGILSCVVVPWLVGDVQSVGPLCSAILVLSVVLAAAITYIQQ